MYSIGINRTQVQYKHNAIYRLEARSYYNHNQAHKYIED